LVESIRNGPAYFARASLGPKKSFYSIDTFAKVGPSFQL